MFVNEETILADAKSELQNKLTVWKLTALWAFSEAVLGGILHAFKIPFSGLFVGGASAVLISLIAFFSEEKTTIIKSTVVVILVKALASPHTPLTAYFAVFLQGFLGSILFYNKNFFRLSALTLTVLTLFLSSVQKIFILTILFGTTLWDSIDLFLNFIINKFFAGKDVSISFSYIIVGAYIFLHIIFGFFIGLIAGKLPYWLKDVVENDSIKIADFRNDQKEFSIKKKSRKKRRWWQRPSGVLFFSFALAVVILSYIYPEFGSNKAYEVIIMTLRAMLIMFIWYTLLAPFFLKLFRAYVSKKQNIYSTEINKIIGIFPQLRSLASYSWKISSTEKNYRRIKSFIIYLTAFLLISDFETE